MLFGYLMLFAIRVLFYIFNYSFFKTYSATETAKAFVVGLLFDTSTLFYINVLVILAVSIPLYIRTKVWWNKMTGVLFIISNTLLALVNVTDIGYFEFSKKRTGIEYFYNLGELENVADNYITDYWYLVLLQFIITILILAFARKVVMQTCYCEPWKAKGYIWRSAVAMGMAIIFVGGVRGGITNLKPINTMDAAKYVAAGLTPLTINTGFQILTTAQSARSDTKNYMSESERAKKYTYTKNTYRKGKKEGSNVVVVILESFGKEYIGYYNPQKKGFTPFLDSLLEKGESFPYSYANGTNSMQAVPSIVGGIPSYMDKSFNHTVYINNDLCSYGRKLAEIGYKSYFFHGGKNGTMGFDGFIKTSGNGEYLGLNEYPKGKDYDGQWGIADEPYLQYVADHLSNQTQPFIATIFTLSSHHPYIVPQHLRNKLPKGTLPIHQSIAYTDRALRIFFERIKTEQWYKNTLFIITADHTSESETAYYKTLTGRYEVPILLFHPTDTLAINKQQSVQHIDIYPTILDYCNYPYPYNAFGQSLFDTLTPKMAVNYENGNYIAIDYPMCMLFSNDKAQNNYNIQTDSLLQKDAYPKPQMEERLKALIQTYTKALNTNSTCR